MLERGVVLSYESIRRWCLKFGSEYARRLKHRRPQAGDVWHVDEVFLTSNGERSYLWRVVDQHGNTLDILVTKKRDKRAARRFFASCSKLTASRERSSPISCARTVQHSESCCPIPLTDRASTSTTELKTRTSGRGDESGGCSALPPPVTPKDSSLFSSLSTPTSALPVTSSKPVTTVKLCASDSRRGKR